MKQTSLEKKDETTSLVEQANDPLRKFRLCFEEFCELNNLVCFDQPGEHTYFQGRSRTKLDYFLFDRSASHMFLSSSFDNGLVIGTDHVPGIL